MTRNRSIWVLATTLSLCGWAAEASAQQPTEARIQELIRQAAARVAGGQAGTQSGTPAGTAQTPNAAGDNRPVVRMGLDDAVKLALDKNLDIAVQRLNPQINDIALSSLKSIYHPTITSTLTTQSQATASTSTLGGSNTAGAAINNGLQVYNGGLSQNLLWGGGNVSVQLNNTRQTSDSQTSLYNPIYSPFWSGTVTQPLMRGFRTDSTRRAIAVTRVNRDISDVQLRASITNTLSNVRNAYWDYVFATQSVDVARQSLALANKLVEDNQTRVQVGTMAPIDVVQAQSEAAVSQQALVAAESSRRSTELALKRLIVSGTEDPNWGAAIDPTDRPEFRPEAVDLEGAIRRALSERTDIAIAKKTVESNDYTLKYLRDQTLPQADVVGVYGLTGLGGTALLTSGAGVNRTVIGTVPGGYGDALGSLLGKDYPRWSLSLNFSYPLGLSSQAASVARAQVQLSQVEAQLRQVQLQVATDVTSATINVRNTAEAVQAAQASQSLAQRKLDAEQSKFEVGMSTNYFVVQAQRDLATAQNSLLQAILNYRKALVELDRVQSTTLQNSNVTVVTAP